MPKKPTHFWIEPDELSRKGLDCCSLEAQGLWLKVMCLLHASERYGYLCRDGKPVTDIQNARRCGIDVEKWNALIAELLEFDLLKRSNDHILYSPSLVTQAEWRVKSAQRQKRFQDRKRSGKYNGGYNGDITSDITDESHPNFKSLNTLSSNEEKSGGKKPTTKVLPPDTQEETGAAYLARKQKEFPWLNVNEVYSTFLDLCGSEKYPNLRNTRRQFDRWLENEDIPLVVPTETTDEFIVEATGKPLK